MNAMETVYIETTIISYLVSKPNRDIIVAANQQMTMDWWVLRRNAFQCFISSVVIEEIEAGDPMAAEKRMREIDTFSILKASNTAEHLTKAFIDAGVIPGKAVRDAAHIAIAAVNGIDYLLTWNCKHLANAQIIRKISKTCNDQGYPLPVICTPQELMGE